MRRAVLLIALLALAACGVDGSPKPLSGGVTVSGEARIGVTGGS